MQKIQPHKKINLEFVTDNIEVDNENKTVRCTLVYKPHIKEFAKMYGRPSNEILEAAPRMCSGLKEALEKERFVTVGVSKCADGETFDVEKGEEIARFRARARAEKKYNNWLYAYLRLMITTADRIDRALAQSDDAVVRNKKTAQFIMKD